MTINEIPLPKAPVQERDGGLITFDKEHKTGLYINDLYQWAHEVAKGLRTTKAQCHHCQAPDGKVTLVLLPHRMTGLCTETGWKFDFSCAVLHECSKTGKVSGWLCSTHENGWYNFKCFSEPEPEEADGEEI